MSHFETSDLSLFDFQAEDVEKLAKQKSRLVGSDPGTGKTFVGIALDLENRTSNGHIIRSHKTLIVCPKSVISVWDDHCMQLTKQDVYVIDSKNRNKFVKAATDPTKGGYFICHWDALRLMPEIQKVKWFHIIADEVHRAKNRKTQMTRALKKIPTQYKTGMSGTPADNKPQDLWSIMNWLWPKYYTSYWNFVKAYIKTETDFEGGYTKFVGVQNLDHLHREMRPWYVRRRKEDVLKDLPDKYYTRVWVDLDPKQRRAYDQMRKTMVAWVEDNQEKLQLNDPIIAQAAVSQLVRLQQYADAYVVPKLVQLDDGTWEQATKFHKKSGEDKKLWVVDDPSSKLDTIMDILEDRSDEQIVVFSQFRSVIDLFAQRMDKAKIPYGLLTGTVSQADRAKNVQDFQDGSIRVFAGTIAAGGVGITLTAASTVIFIDRSWSPAINLQAEDRLHRIGQLDAVEVIDLMARNTVDLGKAQQLAMKWKWLQLILGDNVDADTLARMTMEEDK